MEGDAELKMKLKAKKNHYKQEFTGPFPSFKSLKLTVSFSLFGKQIILQIFIFCTYNIENKNYKEIKS